jgi:hypothetical protein
MHLNKAEQLENRNSVFMFQQRKTEVVCRRMAIQQCDYSGRTSGPTMRFDAGKPGAMIYLDNWATYHRRDEECPHRSRRRSLPMSSSP